MTPRAYWDYAGCLWETSPRDDTALRLTWSPFGPVIGIVELPHETVKSNLGPLVAVA